MQEKRAKGVCFRCDEKYMPGHRCKDRTLQVFLVCEDEEDEEGGGSRTEEEEEKLHLDVAEVSLNSVLGFTPSHTMKVRGEIDDREVVVLIDSGATHNFISTQIVDQMGMELVDIGGYGVMMGTGKVKMGRGVCRGVVLKIQGIQVNEDFLSLELGSTDVILGMKWLRILGETKINWGTLRMELVIGGRRRMIQGDTGLTKAGVSLKSLIRTIHSLEGARVEEGGDIPLSVQPLIQQFQEVFQPPQGLPPSREREHAIVLRDGVSPISVRPFRCPQFQKDEIEWLIREMLEAEIIRPNISPFSSPVLLVKKKDGSWRFCVDYIALNKKTVPDKFLIPVID
ncbi:uncharacterized protein LOC114580971 isoform X2 [Dendrobium catenatum]|uniref:uncharacterized protein LOC114580971 isoform X2 n=1 Tax=Dendrobium catenatum TaxID=906689 RepID=UPI00109FAC5F|nr:uncharacterized protein LOC114580971 isoform X2 [Dendrobium catenatum]